MLLHHDLSDKLASFRLALVDDDFMVFAKLDFVVFKSLGEAFVLRSLCDYTIGLNYFLQIVEELEATY